MSQNSISVDLVIATLIGIFQLFIGLISLWQQRRLCQITDSAGRELLSPNKVKSTSDYAEHLARAESQMAIKALQRSESDETVVGEKDNLRKDPSLDR